MVVVVVSQCSTMNRFPQPMMSSQAGGREDVRVYSDALLYRGCPLCIRKSDCAGVVGDGGGGGARSVGGW